RIFLQHLGDRITRNKTTEVESLFYILIHLRGNPEIPITSNTRFDNAIALKQKPPQLLGWRVTDKIS
ncbi:hypothetical protein CBP16_15470, partial [Fischerella thermalis WC217]